MATKPTHQRAYQANDIDLRSVKVVDLASQLGTEAFHGVDCFEPLGEFLESLLDDGKKHDSVAALVSCVATSRADDDFDEDDDALQHAGEVLAERRHYGMAVHFGTPVRTYHTDRSWSAGWGHYYTQWIYAESFEDAWLLGVAWAEKSAADDLAKFKAESKDGKNGGAA